MSRQLAIAHLDPRSICLLTQAIVAFILTLNLNEALTLVSDSDAFDPEGFMLLEAVRILRTGLLHSISLSLLLGLLTLPLLMLTHLHLLVCSAREMKRESMSISIRGSVECLPAYLLTRLGEWLCLLAFGWLMSRINAPLLSNLNNEISLRTLTPAILVNSLGLVGLLVLLILADSTKLHAVVLSVEGLKLKSRIVRGIIVVRDNLISLLLGRFLRLGLVILVSGALWLMHRTTQFNWWSVTIFGQLGIYLTLSVEAWWYRKMCSYAFKAHIR